MATQRQELAIRDQGFNFTPTTLEEAQQYATIFANSGICPEAYRGRPNDVLIIWQMGNELGLGKMQALRTLGCINGMPFAWGDGLLALVKRHREFEDMREWTEGDLAKGTLTAFCMIKRRNQEPTTQKFSMEDAKRAGLWGKKGTWTQYPARMLQHRARGFAARDAFPDALYGLMSEEEVRHIQEPVEKPREIKGKGISGLEDTLGLNDDDVIEAEAELMSTPLAELIELIEQTGTTQKTIDLWLKKANVTRLDELSLSQIEQGIHFLKNKEQH
jgi:hypothetical protein